MPIASPRFVLAVPASVAPVPPFAIAIAVPVHVPVVIVPRVVRFVLPAQVDRAVFSTLPNPTLDLAKDVIQMDLRKIL